MWLSMNPRLNPFSRRILMLAILAGILHALMPLLMALPAQVGVRMAMCSTLGAKSVFVQFNTSGKPAPDSAQSLRCPLCLAGAHIALTLPIDVQPALLSGLLHEYPYVQAWGVALAPRWPAYHARAPPRA